ncbi:MAG: hypothetical protein KKA07_15930 [Bacteroidetes bacterium]|nr:hypothetical protein [Bacteroidota bacterium]MBU1720553.1 hypothetical protein [Bacteroidota bacterium]
MGKLLRKYLIAISIIPFLSNGQNGFVLGYNGAMMLHEQGNLANAMFTTNRMYPGYSHKYSLTQYLHGGTEWIHVGGGLDFCTLSFLKKIAPKEDFAQTSFSPVYAKRGRMAFGFTGLIDLVPDPLFSVRLYYQYVLAFTPEYNDTRYHYNVSHVGIAAYFKFGKRDR